MTHILLAFLLASPAAAQTLESAAGLLTAASRDFSRAMAERPRAAVSVAAAAVDACRAGRELDRPSLTLRVTPAGGTPFDTVLAFDGCDTRTDDVLFGDETPPWAARYFQARGTPWAVVLETFPGTDTTTLYVFYRKPGAREPELVAMPRALRTADVAARLSDWGDSPVDTLGVLPFKSARFATY